MSTFRTIKFCTLLRARPRIFFTAYSVRSTRSTPLLASFNHGFLYFIHIRSQRLSHIVRLFLAVASRVRLLPIVRASHTLLIKSLSSTQDALAFNEGHDDPNSPPISTSSSVDKHELFNQRVLSWLKDTSEAQNFYRRISVKESIEAHIASMQSLLDTLDAATTKSKELKA